MVTPGLPCGISPRVPAPASRSPGRGSATQVRRQRDIDLEAPKATTPRKSPRAQKWQSEWVRVGVRGAGPGTCHNKPCVYLLSAVWSHSTQLLQEDGRVEGHGRTRRALSSREEQTTATGTGSVVDRDMGTWSFLKHFCEVWSNRSHEQPGLGQQKVCM